MSTISKLRTRRTALAVGATLALGAGAIGSGAHAGQTSWSTSAKVKSANPKPLPKVTNLRYASHGGSSGYDRVVIDLKGKATGYDVRYVSNPVTCGAGTKVSVPGSKYLQVTLKPAHAHTDSGTNTYVGPGNLSAKSTGLPTLKGVRKTCDFEGHVAFVLGLDHKAKFRVGTLSGPTRVYVDVKH